MKRETRMVLEQSFSADQIKQRKGSFGKMLDYIEGHSVIQRLNDAFDSDWSFEVTQYEILEEEVIVMGKLTVGDIVKMQFGGNKITRDSETGKPISITDDTKSAATDSLKKISSLLGVGLSLYAPSGGNVPAPKKTERAKSAPKSPASPPTKKADPQPQNTSPVQPPVAPTIKPEAPKIEPSNGNNGGNHEIPGNGNGDKITPKQLNYVLALAKRNNLTAKAVEGMSKEMFDVAIAYITKNQASALINRLTE